jgi:hypothetical protein
MNVAGFVLVYEYFKSAICQVILKADFSWDLPSLSWYLCYPFICKETLLKKLSSNWRQISWCQSDLLKYLALRRTPGVNRVWLGR